MVPAMTIWVLGYTRRNLMGNNNADLPHAGEMRETNKNTDCSGETWVAEKAEPISPRVAASLGEPMSGCNIGLTRRGVPFWEVNRSDGTMAPSLRYPDL